MLKTLLAGALLVVTAFVTAALAEDAPRVKTVEDVAKLDAGVTAIRMGALEYDVIDAIAKRYPKLERLDISHPGNQVETRAVEALTRLPHLRALTMIGDPFLYDAEFTALGKLRSLTSLRLGLP